VARDDVDEVDSERVAGLVVIDFLSHGTEITPALHLCILTSFCRIVLSCGLMGFGIVVFNVFTCASGRSVVSRSQRL
jgi:hypothetical protein